jgi:hypothetical protein
MNNHSVQLPAAALPRVVQWLGLILFTAVSFLTDSADKTYPPHTMATLQARQLADVWAQFDPRCAADLRAACDLYEQQLGD